MTSQATTPRTNGKGAHGGARPGAGRPPKSSASTRAKNARTRQLNEKRIVNGNGNNGSLARGRLVEAASELLRGAGYESLTVTAICRAADLSPQTFYEHFADKRALLAAIHGPDVEEIDRRLRAAVAERSPLAPALAAALDEALAGLHPSPSSPRPRLVETMIELAGTRGLEAISVPELSAAAGLSRGAFYRHFQELRDCLAAAHALVLERIEDRIREQVGESAEPCERARLAVEALADELARDPWAARIVLVEEAALSGANRRLADLVCSELEAAFPDAPETAHRTAAGGVCSLLRSELATAGAHHLRELAPELTFAASSPIAGSERALEAMQRARANGTPTTSPMPPRTGGNSHPAPRQPTEAREKARAHGHAPAPGSVTTRGDT